MSRRKKEDVRQVTLLDQIDAQSDTEEQTTFIEYGGKKSVILAATAGSGKTYSSVRRLKHLLKRGVDPKKIIFFSFTKAATDELIKRIENKDIKITTIHAFCLSVLLRAGKKKEVTNFFDFIDWYKAAYKPPSMAPRSDTEEFYNHVSEMYESADLISGQISAFKLQRADGIKSKLPTYFLEYEKYQREKRGRDFADMLIEVHELFKEDKWLQMFKGKYDYIFIDEFQDTSTIQLKTLLALNARHYYLIGDKNQCCPAGTLVDVVKEDGLLGCNQERIENIKVGDLVLSGRGSNLLGAKRVTGVFESPYDGELVEIKLKGGAIIRTTPEHVHFAEYIIPDEELYFTYLMYKHDMGFRIGTTRSYSNRTTNGGRFGFKNRLNAEHADRIWLLKVSSTLADSLYHEKVYSCQYGLPTMVFACRGKRDVFNQQWIDRLFKAIDTMASGHKALNDFGYEFSRPHFFPKSSRIERKVVNVGMCGDGRTAMSAHKLEIGTDVLAHVDELKELGFPVFPNTKKQGWRFRTQGPDLGAVINKANQVSAITGGLVNHTIGLRAGKSLKLFKAAHILKGMTMYVMDDNGHISLDVVDSVSRVPYKGMVYDINVENTHNFVANGVFTHNSIYQYTGTNCEKLAEMLRERREVEDMILTINFRSDTSIVENSNNYSNLKARAHSKDAGEVDYTILTRSEQLREVLDSHEEVAVLVRTNKVIKYIEQVFLGMKYPMRYFNFITPKDVTLFNEGKVSPMLQRKLDSLSRTFGGERQLIEFIEQNKDSKKLITSIHKSKGREFNVCVVVNSIAPEVLEDNGFTLPEKEFKKVSFEYDDDSVEERNIHYVAISRARHKLHYMLFGKP
jgi:DNA helicase-2/ATP-dependent DNA helicase PcrA